MLRLLRRYQDSIIGVAPTALFLVGILVLQQHYDYVRTSIDKTVAGLETGTMYVLERGNTAQAGETVEYSSKKIKHHKYFRRIAAGPGAIFSITGTGYTLDGKAHDADAAWRDEAAKEAKNQGDELTIPANHVLIINTDFDSKSSYTNWAFEILPRQQIQSRITRVLFSREITRIGERVAAIANE
jgi:hypothetical protein